jgi:regulatory protein
MSRSESSPVVSGLEKVPRKKEYSLRLSDGRDLRILEDDLAGFDLFPGKALSEKIITEITSSYEYAKAGQAASRLLRVRPRTEAELARGLKTRGFSIRVAARVVAGLKSAGAVDDRLFARLWIEEKVGRGLSGRRLILHELAAKGIDRRVLEEEINKTYDHAQEVEIAGRLARNRMRRVAGLPGTVIKGRLVAYLLRRGFDGDVAGRAVENALADSGGDDLT